MWVKALVECAVVSGAENAWLLGDCKHRLLSHRFPRELHVGEFVGSIRKLTFDVGDED